MKTALIGCWIMVSLALWPRLSWDDFEERERPLVGLFMAFCLPLLIPFVPLFVLGMWAAMVIDEIPRRISKWWNASWA